MEINEVVQMFVNNGVSVACLIYFMWYNNTTMKQFTEQITKMNTNIERLIEHNEHR